VDSLPPATMSRFSAIIAQNAYINDLYQSSLDPHSFHNLVKSRRLTQSENITLGNCMEPFFHDVASTSDGWKKLCVDIIIDGKKVQKDHLFIHESSKTIIYAEQKNNMNLDSEKVVATRRKIQNVEQKLRELYPGYTIKAGALAARYVTYEMPLCQEISRTKNYIKENIEVWGVNEFLALFGISAYTCEEDYIADIEEICTRKFGPV
jgi:hypothetical protein